jgi:hypothetical protein
MPNYEEKLLDEIKELPREMIPGLYTIVHLLNSELLSRLNGKRGSLRGIWKGSQIEDSVFEQARRSLFPYEHRR